MLSRVYVEISNICNMRCSFCHGHSRQKRRMTEAEFARILDMLQGHTNYIYYHLMGEPLLHPLLPRFLELAEQAGFRSVITTNGTLCRERGQALLGAPLHKLSISLHSFEEADEEAFVQYLQEVSDFAELAAGRGIITVLRLWNRGFDAGRNDLALSFLRGRLPGDWAENTRGYRIREKLFLEWGERFQWPDKDAPVLGEQVRCHGLTDHVGILADGTVVPCCLDGDGVIALGNIFEEDLGAILASPRARAMAEGFRRRFAAEDLCRRCGYARKF